MNKKPILFLFILFSMNSVAQEKNRKETPMMFDQAEITVNSGMIMPHTLGIDFVTKDYTSSFNMNLLKTMNGKTLWENLYHYPNLGLGYYYGTLGNNKIYGKAHSLYALFEAPAIKISQGTRVNYRMSAGLSYVTRPFDPQKNQYNIAIGSHLNLHFNMHLNGTVRIIDKFWLVPGISFTHVSNGDLRLPNKGLNIIKGSLGLRYNFQEKTPQPSDFTRPKLKDKNHFSVIWSHGIKDYGKFERNFYYISSLNVNYERHYAHVAKGGIGLDAFYDPSLKNTQSHPSEKNLTNPKLYTLGVHISHDMIVGDFSLTVQVGHYLYNKMTFISDIYNRVGLKYYYDRLIFNLSLKSHKANAEFIEFGIGYSL